MVRFWPFAELSVGEIHCLRTTAFHQEAAIELIGFSMLRMAAHGQNRTIEAPKERTTDK